jgi:hypothetical protein
MMADADSSVASNVDHEGSGDGENDILSTLDDHAVAFFKQLRRKKQECNDAIRQLKEQLGECELKIGEEKERLGIDDADSERKALLNEAVQKFNDKPKKGIQLLVDNDFFPNNGTAVEIAQFLLGNNDLAKAAIGEYLGDFTPLNLQVGSFRCSW